MLARTLVEQGHAVRGTTREPERLARIEAAGAQPVLADPDRIGTVLRALEHVSVAVILLGCAHGSEQALRDLHGPRLEALLTKMVDTTIHGLVYETQGTVGAHLLAAGAAAVQAFGERSTARVAFLDADPARPEAWLRAGLSAVQEALRAS